MVVVWPRHASSDRHHAYFGGVPQPKLCVSADTTLPHHLLHAAATSYSCSSPHTLLGIHIVQMDLAPRTSAFALVFPKYSFYVPNPRILGTRPVLPCKNDCCCKLELVEQRACLSYGTVAICLPWVAHRWNCHTSKFGSCCAYRSGEIRVLRISHSCICFP